MFDIDQFCEDHRTLYHLAADGSWPSICKHGLLSSQEVLKRFDTDEHVSNEIEKHRRAKSYVLEHPEHGRFVLRDRKPLHLGKLKTALEQWHVVEDRVNTAQWIELLNKRVFFFARKKNLEGLLGAKQKLKLTHVILEVDTELLFKSYASSIEVADINTGSALYIPVSRGKGTFQPIGSYVKTGSRKIVEVTVPGSIPDILPLLQRAVLRKPCGTEQVLYGAALE